MRVCRGNWERTEIGTWMADVGFRAARDPRVSRFETLVIDQCPTDAARNSAAVYALESRTDVLFSIDHDNAPHPDWFGFGLDYQIRKGFCAVLASPYCGARPGQPGNPDREVQVVVKDAIEPDGRRRVSRAEAAALTGVRPAYGVGTVLAIGCRVFEKVPPPWWEYKYFDPHHTHVGTEDFAFSEKCADAGIDVEVAWDHFSGHAKQEVIGRPRGADL